MQSPPRRLRLRFMLLLLGALIAVPLQAVAQEADSLWSPPVDATQGSTAQMGSFDVLLCDPYQNSYLLWAEQSSSGGAIYLRSDAPGSPSAARDVIAIPGAVVFNLAAAIAAPA